jgi:hypothetical protein
MLIIMVTFGRLNVKNFGEKLISMWFDGSSVFQSARVDAITQVKDDVTLFMTRMHCFAHRTNLAMFVRSMLSLVVHLEALL